MYNDYLDQLSKDVDDLEKLLEGEKIHGIKDAGRNKRIAALENEYNEALESYNVAYYESM